MIQDTQTVRDIALALPGATAVLRGFKIDFCCNGQAPLAEAVARRGLDIDRVKAALEALEAAPEPAPTSVPDLIDHILSRYHVVHMAEFPEAIRMARRVEAVHRERSDCPAGLADHLAFMADDLAGHQNKEEQVLFPMMLAGGSPMISMPIGRMMAEHLDVGAQLEELARLTTDFTPPPQACTTWRALYNACAKLDADLREHMHLENNVLFPAFLSET